jgi:cobalt-zinc-cadmium efflux system membrane fusion protein
MVESMGRIRPISALSPLRCGRAIATRRCGRVKRGLLWAIAAGVLTVLGGVFAVRAWSTDGQGNPGSQDSQAQQKAELVSSAPDTIFLPENVVKMLGVSLVEARSAGEPRLLEMQGSLALDTNKLVRVHARFAGEVIEIAAVADDEAPHTPGQPARRPMCFGDRVKKDQLMAVVWSKDLGEKKSELIDGLSQLRVDQDSWDRLSKAYAQGAIPEKTMHDVQRNVEADQIAVSRAERTLEAWRLPEGEIQAVREEAQAVHERHGKRNSLKEKDWARVEVRAPFDGVVVEKNLAVGDIIDTTNDLFKVASLGQMIVWANAREEDVPSLLDLPLDRRNWSVRINAEPGTPPLGGRMDRIGYISDPTQHTVMVMGHIDNLRERYRAGQFITATVQLPPASGEVAVPAAAVVEDGQESVLFVETDPRQSHFRLRHVVVVRRTPKDVYVRAEVKPEEAARGLQPVRPGERVVAGSAIQLRAALDDLLAAAKTRKP